VSNAGPLIHVVDDDELVRDGLSRLLRSVGYDVRTFPSAAAFLEQRSGQPGPCCVVLDVMMPQMNGLELQIELQSLEPRLPIVFISGHPSDAATSQALDARAVAFLPKPVDPDQLLAAVATATAPETETDSDTTENDDEKPRANHPVPLSGHRRRCRDPRRTPEHDPARLARTWR